MRILGPNLPPVQEVVYGRIVPSGFLEMCTQHILTAGGNVRVRRLDKSDIA